VGTAAFDLSTLAGGGGGGRWAPPYERESKKVKPSLVSKMWRVGQRSPTSGWRIPVSSSSGARQTLWPPPAWPPPHPRPSQRRAPAPPRRASPLSYAVWRRALPRPPHALFPLPSPRLWAKAPTSRGGSVPHRSPPPHRSTISTLKTPGRRVQAARAAETPHSSTPGAPVAVSSSPSCARPSLALAAALRVRPLGLGAWAGRTARRSRRSPTEGE
jgi:hypothetical protein